MQLLKSINPAEAGLLDAASRCHIRFRLGGDRFPPLIYYKIFVSGGIVDINAFAPRDYNAIKKEVKKDKIDIKYDRPENDNHDGWYQRIERNGWRPISDKILTPGDTVYIPQNALHGLKNIGNVPFEVLWIFPTDTWSEIDYHYE